MGKKKQSVLIVDDFNESADALMQMFEHLDIGVAKADSAEEALKQIEQCKFMLVIADSRLKDRRGEKLLKEIRTKHPDTRLAVLSTFNTANTQQVVITDKIDYYLPKPVKMKHLEEMIASLGLKL